MKDIDAQELLVAVREGNAGRRSIPPYIEGLLHARIATPTLTPREFDVLHLIVRGLTNKEIANILGASINTIRNQPINIFAKLEVAHRAEATSAALQRGLVPPTD